MEEKILPYMDTQKASVEPPKPEKRPAEFMEPSPKRDKVEGAKPKEEKASPVKMALPPELKEAPPPAALTPGEAEVTPPPPTPPPKAKEESPRKRAPRVPKHEEEEVKKPALPPEQAPKMEEPPAPKKEVPPAEPPRVPSPKPVEMRKEKVEKAEIFYEPKMEKVPEPERPAAPLAPLPPAPRRIEEEPQPPAPKPRVKKISPPQEPPPAAVPPQTIPVELRTAREYEPPVEPQAPPSDRLRVNIDEILRLGAIMERRHMSSTKKLSFEWIALNRHIAHLQPEAFSSHLATAVGDVRLEKSLACDALNVLMYQHTITPDEYLRLCQHLDTVSPITISTLAQLLRTNTMYYNSLQNTHRTAAGPPPC